MERIWIKRWVKHFEINRKGIKNTKIVISIKRIRKYLKIIKGFEKWNIRINLLKLGKGKTIREITISKIKIISYYWYWNLGLGIEWIVNNAIKRKVFE